MRACVREKAIELDTDMAGVCDECANVLHVCVYVSVSSYLHVSAMCVLCIV